MGFGEGLSWVKGICQKLETSAEECFEACNDYVVATGENLKKMYDEVCYWDHLDHDEGSDSSFNLKFSTITEISIETANLSANDSSDTKASIHPCKSQNLSVQKSFDQINEQQLAEENCEEISDTFKLASDTSSPRQYCDQIFENENDEKLSANDINDANSLNHEDTDVNALSGESQNPSHQISCVRDKEEPVSKENCKENSVTFKLASVYTSSPKQACDQVLESENDESRVPSVEVKDMSDNREDFTSSTPDMAFQNAQKEEFETIEAEDCEDEIENEITLISQHRVKNKSFKKKLSNVLKSLKQPSQVKNYQDECNSIGFRDKFKEVASSIPSGDRSLKLSNEDSADSEWELL